MQNGDCYCSDAINGPLEVVDITYSKKKSIPCIPKLLKYNWESVLNNIPSYINQNQTGKVQANTRLRSQQFSYVIFHEDRSICFWSSFEPDSTSHWNEVLFLVVQKFSSFPLQVIGIYFLLTCHVEKVLSTCHQLGDVLVPKYLPDENQMRLLPNIESNSTRVIRNI